MAEDLDDGEFWLPSQFLTDDDILKDATNMGSRGEGMMESESRFCFPSEFPYGFASSDGSSALSSPVESVVGSTETESDEEDYLAGLTRQMARTMLQDVEKGSTPVFASESPKTRVVAGSPQSTLCAVGSWCGGSAGSSRGSPNGPSQVSSPPSTPVNAKDDAWDLLYAAAGQVVRIKMNNEVGNCHRGRGLLGPPRKLSPVLSQPASANTGFYPAQALTQQQQMQVNHFNQLKQQQQQQLSVWGRQGKVMNPAQQQQQQQPYNGSRPGNYVNGRCNRPLGLPSSAWPPLQQAQVQPPQQAGSGMRAVFLDGSGARRECAGTGVFLPRTNRNPEPRKKPACSTVLLPARVVQALNLNFDDLGASHSRYVGGGLAPSNGNPILSQQKRHFRPQAAPIKHEVRLPQEWTY